jgi:hypothetical protein
MLVTFFCEAYENITLFGDVANVLLNFMQHSATIPGAILAKDVPKALASLQEKVAAAKSTQAEISSSSKYEDEPEISIDKRAIPVVALLKAAIKADCDVMWRYG